MSMSNYTEQKNHSTFIDVWANDETELGTSGLHRNRWNIDEEWHRELRGFRAQLIFREMSDNEACLGAIFRLFQLLALHAKWSFESADDRAESRFWAEFANQCIDDMDISWRQVLTEMVSVARTGFYYGELIYKIRRGESADFRYRSNYADGLIGWRKISNRGAQTVFGWRYDEEQRNLLGMVQQIPSVGGLAYIPLQKALHIAIDSEVGNPEGRSMLRNAYVSYRNAKNMRTLEGYGYEKNVGGYPIAEVPPHLLSPAASENDKAIVKTIGTNLAQLRRGERTYMMFPAEFDHENKRTGYKLRFAEAGSGDGQSAIHTAIMRYQKDMAISVLGEFVYLGTDKAGSYALSSDKTSMFLKGVEGIFDTIVEQFNRQALAQLMRANGVPRHLWPRLVYKNLHTPDVEQVCRLLDTMHRVGQGKLDDPTIQAWLRDLVGMPWVG